MNLHITALAILLALPFGVSAGAGELDPATRNWLEAAVAGEHRDPAKRARDQYRHPRDVLAFFGLTPDSSVAEIWPSDGWWTEILAPALRDNGAYYAAGFAMTADRTPEWRKSAQKRFAEKLEAQPELYDAVVTTELSVPERTTIAPPGSLDLVVTFRNVHNWIRGDYAPAMFRVMARALRPGGVLGLVTHRAPPGWTADEAGRTGYVAEALVIEMAEAAGLVLEASSEINANPRDTHDHEAGVWTLPPSFALCGEAEDADERVACEGRYRSIGESDRMTLRFRKRAPGAEAN
ncbi:MAG: methyltransferase [Gammaproteobacteria bacterium]|nr:methyltransferase [Gammaproteobacteria bacterium]